MIEWKHTDGLVPYEEALAFMEARVADISAGTASECIWLLEHPPLYTAGTSAKREDLVAPTASPFMKPDVAGSIPIMVQANVLSMSCSMFKARP